MNYGELKNVWKQYTHRSDLDAIIPTINEIVRARIGRDARLRENEISIPISHDDSLPDDFVSVRKVANIKQHPMSFLTHQQYGFERQARSGGIPTIYTMVDGVFLCVAGVANMVYFSKPTALVNDFDTNEMLSNWPQFYIHAGGAEIKRWSEDDESVHEGFYESEMFKANKSAEIGRIGDAPAMRAL